MVFQVLRRAAQLRGRAAGARGALHRGAAQRSLQGQDLHRHGGLPGRRSDRRVGVRCRSRRWVRACARHLGGGGGRGRRVDRERGLAGPEDAADGRRRRRPTTRRSPRPSTPRSPTPDRCNPAAASLAPPDRGQRRRGALGDDPPAHAQPQRRRAQFLGGAAASSRNSAVVSADWRTQSSGSSATASPLGQLRDQGARIGQHRRHRRRRMLRLQHLGALHEEQRFARGRRLPRPTPGSRRSRARCTGAQGGDDAASAS